ncbi:BLUF domain-containing protein [Microbacterium sp. NPDC091313]
MSDTASDRLISVVYSSTAVDEFDDAALTTLLAQCRAANAADGVTGMLLYRAGRFVQVLEGPESVIRPLLARIADDPRHTGMRVLFEEPLAERNFAEWTMGFEPIRDFAEDAPEGFRSTFDDLEQAGDGAATMRAVRELSLWFRVRANRAS